MCFEPCLAPNAGSVTVLTISRAPQSLSQVHEAAAMALGDVCATPDIAMAAVEAGAIEALAKAMSAMPTAGALQENAAWAVKQVGLLASNTRPQPLLGRDCCVDCAFPHGVSCPLVFPHWSRFASVLRRLYERG
jgi:hypothetical protein